MKQQKGTASRSLLLLSAMNETLLQTIEKMVDSLLDTESGDFLVSVKIKPTNNIKVFIDSDGGLSIDKCVRYNRALYKQLEESEMFPDGNFSLEVSSPGITEPLKLNRQYQKNIGRLVEVVYQDETTATGKLLAVTDNDILVEQTTGKGKKAETRQLLIPFNNIKSTTVQIQF